MRKFLAALVAAVAIFTTGHAEAQNFSSVQVLNGSCQAPSFTFQNDTDTGFYLSGVGTLGVCIGGVQVATINSSGIAMDQTGKPVRLVQTNGRIEVNGTYDSLTASEQAFMGDLTLSGTSLGKTGGYVGGGMGHVKGASTVTAAGNNGSQTAGLIGKYSIAGTGYTPGYLRAGVLGEVSGTADCAICAVASDSTNQEAITIHSLFGVDHQMGFGASKINWGLDLFATSHDVYTSKTYTKGDIRMGNEICILNGSGAPVNGTSGTGANDCQTGSLYIRSADGALYSNTGTKSSPTWTAR